MIRRNRNIENCPNLNIVDYGINFPVTTGLSDISFSSTLLPKYLDIFIILSSSTFSREIYAL